MRRFIAWLYRTYVLGKPKNTPVADLEALQEVAPSRRSNDALKQMDDENYVMETTQYFTVRKVENGHVLTCRTYVHSQTPNGNPYGPGPSYVDKQYVIPEGALLIDTIAAALVANRIGK